MKTLLKKTGIVVAAVTAGLLVASPLAFADDVEGDCNVAQSTGDSTALALLIAASDVISDANVAVPICDNNVNVQVIPIFSPNAQAID